MLALAFMATTTRFDSSTREFVAPERTLFAGAVYLLWLGATWSLEKQVSLFARYDPVGRAEYALVANVLVGTALAAVALRKVLGLRAELHVRPLLLAAIAIGGGLALVNAVPEGARSPIVLVNAFAQVLPTSIAEVVTCFLLVGKSAEAAATSMGKVPAAVVGVAAGDAAFAVYHFAHSAPFDQPAMVAFLALPGLVTALVLFVARDLVTAVLAQSLFAMIGVTKNADLDVFRHPFSWAYAVAAVAVAVAFAVFSSDAGASRTRIA